MKKSVVQSILFASCLSILNPMIAYAKEDKSFGWKKALKKVVEGAEIIDEKINDTIVEPAKDKLGEIDLYKEDSLWLITDIPEENPDEKRNYYFVDKNTPTYRKSYYYDKKGNEVSRKDPSAVKRIDKELYPSISDFDKTFLIKTKYDLKDFTFETNLVDLDTETVWIEDTNASFGRFTDVSLIIPEDMQKEKYSTEDLQEILEILNDCDYEFKNTTKKLTK